MKYAYEMTYNNGGKVFSIQNYNFSEKEMLDYFQKEGVVRVKFLRQIPRGYHLCGCGNLAKGTRDELCDECREIYGHYYEHEL